MAASAPYRGDTSFEDFTNGTFVMTPDEVVDHIDQLSAIGINYVITYFPRVAMDHGMMQHVAESGSPQCR